MSKIGNQIKKLRKMLGFSQSEFAKRLGVTQRVVSHWERNESEPSLEIIRKIINLWSVNFYWLLTGEGKIFSEEIDDFREKNSLFKEWIDYFWSNSTSKEKIWFEIQFSKCFPEFLEWLKKKERK